MKILKRAKNIIIKIDDFREEKLEDYVASVFAKLDENETVDSLEKKGILAGYKAIAAYAKTYGLPLDAVPQEVQEKIADEVVKALGKANKALQKQLKKKSKAYLKRKAESGEV